MDIVGVNINSVFQIGPKMTTAQRKKDACGLLCVCACVCVCCRCCCCLRFDSRFFHLFFSFPPLIRFLSLHFSATSKIQCRVEKLSKRYNFTLFRTLEVANGLPVNVSQLICIPFIFCVWPYPTVSNHSCLSQCGSFNKWLTSITHKYAMAVERI